MSQTVGVDMEPLKWPIAPDGYIPNSVIRSWGWKDKGLNKVDCWHDLIYSLHQLDEDDQTDESTRIFWFRQDEEEEEEETEEVKRKKKKMENDINKKDKKVKMEMEEKESADQKKTWEEDQMDRVILMKQSYNTQTSLQSHLKTSDEEKLNVEPQRETSYHENGPKQLIELREDMKLHEAITPPLSVPKKQRTSSFVSKVWPEPAVESPVVSADTIISKQEPRTTLYVPLIEPKNLSPHPLEPPSPNSVDHQLQQDLEPPECPPIRDKEFLLSSTKYSSTRDQIYMPLDWKVLQLHKKLKIGNKNLSHLRKFSTKTQHSRASKVVHPTVPTNTGELNLYSGLDSPPASNILQSTIQTQPPGIIHPECPSNQLCSDYPAQLVQTILLFKDQRGYESMPEWRKNLYKLISLEGFRSPRAARLATTDNLVKSSDTRRLVATMPSLQPGQAAAHQRVVQKIHMTDTVKLPSFQFHQVIPMASQHNVYTLNPCGKTQYGRLEFDWMRGSEDTLL